MNLSAKPGKTLIFGVLGLFLNSCRPAESTPKKPSFSPLQNGFGVVVQEMGIDSGPGAKLYYKGTNENPVLVWPYIGTWGDPILFTNDIALLHADIPDEQGSLGGSALIVAQGPSLAMDISKDVLKIAAEQSQVDFKKALRVCWPASLVRIRDDKLQVIFGANWVEEPTIKKLKVEITWKQVFEIMEDVKSSGKTNKVTNTDVLYLQKDYSH